MQLFANEKGIAYDEVILQYDEVDLSYDMFYRDIETILLKYTKFYISGWGSQYGSSNGLLLDRLVSCDSYWLSKFYILL